MTGQLDTVFRLVAPFGSFPFSLLNTLDSALVCARFTLFVCSTEADNVLAKEVKSYTNTCFLSTSPCPVLR